MTVNSIWSPLTRRRWWNHIDDDTALCGITSAMIRRQPDHLTCPSPHPVTPSNSFAFQSDLLRTATRRMGELCGRQANPALPASSPGIQERACFGLAAGVQVPQSMVLRNTSSDTTAEFETRSQTVAGRDTLQDSISTRQCQIRGRRITGMISRWFYVYACAPLVNRDLD